MDTHSAFPNFSHPDTIPLDYLVERWLSGIVSGDGTKTGPSCGFGDSSFSRVRVVRGMRRNESGRGALWKRRPVMSMCFYEPLIFPGIKQGTGEVMS